MKNIFIFGLLTLSCFAQTAIVVKHKAAPGGVSLFYGPGCNGVATNTCTVQTTDQATVSRYPVGAAFTTGNNAAGYSLNACGVYQSAIATSPNNVMRCAIYSGSPPTTKICEVTADATLAANSWTENTSFAGCTLNANTTYWIFSGTPNNSNTYRRAASGSGGYYFGLGSEVWPSIFRTPITATSTNLYSQYVRLTAK
jgi:hypothetical protein